MTKRDEETLLWMVDDLNYAEIAAAMGVGSYTVNQHAASLRRSFDAKTTHGMIARAYHEGVLTAPSLEASGFHHAAFVVPRERSWHDHIITDKGGTT